MTGVLWAAASGIGFGLFQSLNGRAVRRADDLYVATFFQLVVALVVLIAICVATGDLGTLDEATTWGIVAFALAGLLHFFLGWTLLNMSQERIGAARTGPLLTTTPLFGVVLAAVTVGQIPGLPALAGIALMVLGAWWVSTSGRLPALSWQDSAFAFGTALMWAGSPVLTLEGLEGLESPLLGVTIGLLVSVVAYGLLLSAWPARRSGPGLSRGGIALRMLAGLVVALATWGRWAAIDLTDVGVVLALNLLALPVVLLLAPIIIGKHLEQVNATLWLGAGLIVAGSLMLIAVG